MTEAGGIWMFMLVLGLCFCAMPPAYDTCVVGESDVSLPVLGADEGAA